MRLNETRNVLWHESCKCVWRLNLSVCNSKQIWNSDRSDYNEDFAGIINFTKGYMWNPSTCACVCDSDNTTTYIFIGLFSVLLFIGIVCFCVFAYLRWIKGKNYLKTNILIIEQIRMNIESLEIKTKTNYNWGDIIYINDFDVNSLEIIKRESRIGANTFYIGYVLNPDYDYSTTDPLYFVINRLIGYIEEIKG